MAQRTKLLILQLWTIKHAIITHPLMFISVWVLTFLFFVYALTFDVFIAIFTSDALNIFDKIQFMISSVTNVLSNAGNPQIMSVIIFSLIATINILLIIIIFRSKRKIRQQKTSTISSLGIMIGSHCVACGGSLLAPILTVFGWSGGIFVSTGSANISTLLIVGINTVGIVLVGRATLKMSYRDYALIYLDNTA